MEEIGVKACEEGESGGLCSSASPFSPPAAAAAAAFASASAFLRRSHGMGVSVAPEASCSIPSTELEYAPFKRWP